MTETRDDQGLDDQVSEAVEASQEVEAATPNAPVENERPIIVNQAGMGSVIAGGVIAAAIGAAGALTFLPEGWRKGPTADLNERVTQLEGQSGAIDAHALDRAISEALTPLLARIEALEGAPAPDLSPVTQRIEALEAGVGDAGGVDPDMLNGAIATAVQPLSDRLSILEGGLPEQTQAAINSALAASRAAIEAQAQSLVEREEVIEMRSALTQLDTASSTGDAAPEALALLASHTDVPAALNAFNDGLPTLAALQESFPEAARAALAAAPSPEGEQGVGGRFLTFLRSQTGARSLTPQEGDSTDAILSRAEAALRMGDIDSTLTALDGLPDGPAAQMSAWATTARTRLDAMSALHTLNDQLNQDEG